MATLTHVESRRLYSWWWDSHVSPKNSKWLQENLKDMDAKVKGMIKLIEEDADSFARRAEMYYKKRPELMKLVEEFYRAYRALAERYNHATGELRQAHRTMAEAFPNLMADDSPSGQSTTETGPHTPEMPHPIRAFFEHDDLQNDAVAPSTKMGLKQLNEMFEGGGLAPHNAMLAEGKARKGLNFRAVEERDQKEAEVETLRESLSKLESEKEALLIKYQKCVERLSNLETEVSRAENHARGLNEQANKAETEVQILKETRVKLEAEKEVVLLQCQKNSDMMSNLENEVSRAQEDSKGLNERTNKAETEVKNLKEALTKLEAEKGLGLLQCQQYLEKISDLETKISLAQEEVVRLNEKASNAETEAQSLKQTLAELEAEKEAGLLQYKLCLEMIPNLETKVSVAEEDARRFNERADKAESEVQTLKIAFAKLEGEKEDVALKYQQCLERVSYLEAEISRAHEEITRLNGEMKLGIMKLDKAEEKCLLLERENHSLHSEVEILVQKTGMQDQELSEKLGELERLEISIQEESMRFLQAEAAIQTLENLNSQSQDEKRALSLELQSGAQTLKDMEVRNQGLDNEVKQVKEENRSLNEQNLSSATSIKNLQEELLSLRALIGKLEEEVELRVDERNALQQEIYCLREEINDMNRQHHGVVEQIESVGLNSKCIGSSVKELQNENLKLKQICEKDNDEKVTLLKKLENMERLLEKNALLENSLSDVNAELEGLREKVKMLEESCQTLKEEKSVLITEKATLNSQLESISDDMEKLSEKNKLLENSLSDATVELEGLRAKSKNLEESCESLQNENSCLLVERNTLASELDGIRLRLQDLEGRYTRLEEKYLSQEREKDLIRIQVEELRVSLNLEKQERANSTRLSETRLARLENQICVLQQEGQWRKKDFEEELDRAIMAQVEIFILKKCMGDMEDKNFALQSECQKHTEASKLSEKLISELEQENIEQEKEVKSLIDHIENLRMGIHQILKLLEVDPVYGGEDRTEEDKILLQHILGNFEDMKSSILEERDQKQKLLVENSVLVTLLGQLRFEASDLQLERNTLDQELKMRNGDLLLLQSEKHEIHKMNEELMSVATEGARREEILKAEMENVSLRLSNSEERYVVLQNENSKLLEENGSRMEELSDLKEENCKLEVENSVVLGEAIALGNLSTIFESFATEKAEELKGVSEDLDSLFVNNNGLKNELKDMGGKLEKVGTENLHLKQTVEQLGNELNIVMVVTKIKNSELQRDLDLLLKENEEENVKREELEKQVLALSEDNSQQKKQIGYLHEVNGKVESELGTLHEEKEELKRRESSLNSELQERRNEVRLLEAEAMAFYNDFHTSTICEALYEDKVRDLTAACMSLGNEATSRSLEIEKLKERVSILEGENGGLKAQFVAYSPIILSLKDSILSLENHVPLWKTRDEGFNQKPEDAELDEKSYQKMTADQRDMVPMGLLELQKLQVRVEAVEKAMIEMKNHAIQENLNTVIKPNAAIGEIEELKSKESLVQEKEVQTRSNIVLKPEKMELGDKSSGNLPKDDPEISEMKNGLLVKDIPLDHISDSLSYDHGMSKRENKNTYDQIELWETTDGGSSLALKVTKAQKPTSALTHDNTEYHQIKIVDEQTRKYPTLKLKAEKELGVDLVEVPKKGSDPRQEGNRKKVLERLSSDAQKLTNLQVTLQDLKTKVEVSGKIKKSKNMEYDSLKRQLEEIEEGIMQLININGNLTKNAEEETFNGNSSTELEELGNVQRRRVLEQARRGSEKIGRLQLELQRIQIELVKLEAENESKARFRVIERRKRILLRDYLYGVGKSSQMKKKAPFCACGRPSTVEE